TTLLGRQELRRSWFGTARSRRRASASDRRRNFDCPGVVRFGESAVCFDINRYSSEHARASHGSALLTRLRLRHRRLERSAELGSQARRHPLGWSARMVPPVISSWLREPLARRND